MVGGYGFGVCDLTGIVGFGLGLLWYGCGAVFWFSWVLIWLC